MKKTKILFLNLPHPLTVSRRYMCTYYSPMFLLPPHDLIQLATYVRTLNDIDVLVLDAIGEKSTEADVLVQIQSAGPDMVVSLAGVETFGQDMECLERLKKACPNLTFAIFGYYPSTFPEDILKSSGIDLILRSEPEEPLGAYLNARRGGSAMEAIPGLAGRRDDGSIFSNKEQRIKDLDALPFSDYSLVKKELYEEAFLGGPCGAILSTRGCPFPCTYCTTTYGRQIMMKSPEVVVEEMKHLVKAGIKFIRFLDDTFTLNPKRVIAICQGLLEANLQVSWSCLSRVDTLDEEMLVWMARAGCKRVLIGIESYSQNVLNYLNKRLEADRINPQVALVHKAGIEAIGFFIVGCPVETEADFQETLKGVLSAPLDFIAVNTMTPYAGTPFFEQIAHDIHYSLLPYRCEYKDEQLYALIESRKRRLYLRFYLRPGILWHHLNAILRHPLRSLRLLWLMTKTSG